MIAVQAFRVGEEDSTSEDDDQEPSMGQSSFRHGMVEMVEGNSEYNPSWMEAIVRYDAQNSTLLYAPAEQIRRELVVRFCLLSAFVTSLLSM